VSVAGVSGGCRGIGGDLAEAYARAERLLPGNADRLIVDGAAAPHFLHGCDRFWFLQRSRAGHRFLVADPARGTVEPAFDHGRLAEGLARAGGVACDAARLPFTDIELGEDGAVRFAAVSAAWRWDARRGICERIEDPALAPGWSRSPDGRWAVRHEGFDLWLLDRANGAERALTTDGSADRPYGHGLDWRRIERARRGLVDAPAAVWSPDSTAFVVEWIDQSQVRTTHFVEARADDPRPRLLTLRDALPGDPHVARSSLLIVRPHDGGITPIAIEPVPVTLHAQLYRPSAWWSRAGDRLEVVTQDRAARSAWLYTVDPGSGAARVVLEERRPSVLDPAPLLSQPPNARVLDDGRALWCSERDGWNHLWLVDGGAWRQLTRGEWVVRELLDVDEAAGVALVTACGREPHGGPYDRRLYGVALGDGKTELLTPEPLDHRIAVSPTGAWLVDAMSSVAEPTSTVLRTRDGACARRLAGGDAEALRATGWTAPTRFTVTAADRETPLHGLLYLPSRFDERASWPLLDLIYPGPQAIQAPTRFGLSDFHFEALAELGFAAMVVDARGTPLRSKAFHDAAYGALDMTAALADHAAAVVQLAARCSWIDGTRVGIVGHSGGGHAAVRAMIEHPDVYSVGVACVGNHDNRRYRAGWGERYLGPVDESPEAWRRQSNVTRAHELRGRLLLAVAEMDVNVHPANTRALIAALVAADIDHDVVVLPDHDHWVLDSPYLTRRIWDHLVTNLGGASPPPYRISPGSLTGPAA
jgi:dipeptidyl-peptidase-4